MVIRDVVQRIHVVTIVTSNTLTERGKVPSLLSLDAVPSISSQWEERCHSPTSCKGCHRHRPVVYWRIQASSSSLRTADMVLVQ